MNKFAMGCAVLIGAAPIFASAALSDLKLACDYPATAKEARLINATAMLVQTGSLQYNASTNTYNVINTPVTTYLELFNPNPVPICSNSLFYGDPSATGRTGVLIAPNMILTSPHAPSASFDPRQFSVVFRASQATAGDPSCTNFTWSNIPASDVYFVDPTSSTPLVDTFNNADGGAHDYAVLKLTQNVVNRAPVKIRRSGAPRLGDLIISAGYPLRTPERVDSAAFYEGIGTVNTPTTGIKFVGDMLFANFLNDFDGDSGAPAYNPADDVVEAVQAWGTDAGFNRANGAQCGTAGLGFEQSDINGNIVDVASQIPRNEILVAPLDEVVHVSAIGGATDKPSSTYTITPAATGANIVTLSPIQGPTGTAGTVPVINYDVSGGLYTVPAGGMTFHIDADTSVLFQCGTWEYEADVQDIGNGGDNMIRHRFEIGLTEVSVAPADDWIDNDIGSPYTSTRTYTLKNVRPTPATVHVYAGGDLPASVVTINGGGATTVTLGAAGTATDTQTLVVGIASGATSLTTPGTVYNLTLSFDLVGADCPVTSSQTRNIKFKRGERQFQSVQGATLLAPPASGQTLGAASRFDVDLSAIGSTFCVSDLNLDTGFPTPAHDLSMDVPAAEITLTSPSGRSGVLWERDSYPGGAYGVTDPGPYFTPFLHLDDQVSPPLGPTLLSYFNNQKLKGHWYVDVRTSSGYELAGPVRLDFTATTACLSGGN
jgi:hypothetical protein